MGIISGLLSLLFWGIALFLAGIVSRKIGNVITLFWMQIFGFLAGIIYFLMRFDTFVFSDIPIYIPVLIVIAVLQITAYLSFYKGAEKGQLSLVSPIGSSWGLVTAILGVVLFDEKVKLLQVFAVFLIIVGIILISINLKSIISSKEFKFSTGVREGIIAMLGWGISLSLLVYPTNKLGWFLPSFLFRFLLIILLGLLIILTKKSFFPKNSKFPILTLIVIGVTDMAAFISLYFGISKSSSSVVAPIGSSYAIITVLLAVIFLKEKLKLHQIIGILTVISGIVLISL